MSHAIGRRTALETPISLVKGTADWLPADHARLVGLEMLLLDRFARAGYDRLSTPVLEPVELHERKSGAGIVSKLFEIPGQAAGRACLRPELTAGIVRAFTAADPPPTLPWRVSHSGPAFRRESPARADRLREFHQVGVERLGDSGAIADAEVIWLASWAVSEAGVRDSTIRVGHVGLILELLGRSGLPPTAQAALVEMLSEAAAEGGDVGSLGRGLDHFTEWLRQASDVEEVSLPIEGADDAGVDRLFRTLVPVVNGRRPGHEIIRRLRRKWDLGHGWMSALDGVREHVRALVDLKGPASEVLDRLARDFEALAPKSVASLGALVRSLGDHGVDLDRVELDLGFGRGIGFYSRMVFEIVAPTPEGPVEICGGGRYDGLARVLGSERDDRGVGFAFGLERVARVLEAQGVAPEMKAAEAVVLIPSRPEATPQATRLATMLRSRGVRAILDAEGSPMDGGRPRSGRVVVVGDGRGDDSLILHDPRRPSPDRVTPQELLRIVAESASAGELKP